MSFCDTSCKAAWQRRQKPVDRAWLVEHYERRGMNCVQIAKLVGRNPKAVWDWLVGYGIATRPRGSDLKRQWKEGERSHPGGFPHTDATKEKIRAVRAREGNRPVLKDGKPYMRGRKGALAPNWQGGITPERPALSGTDEWKAAVKAVWARSDAKCERCGADHRAIDNRKANGFHVHHIIPFRHKEFRCEVSNLALLCRPCHHFVHSKKNTSKEFIKCP